MALTQVRGDGLNSGAISTVNSDGGAVTTSVVQGLAKAWHTLHGTGTISTLDSLNITSITDSGTGSYAIFINNDFANANYASTSSSAYASGGVKTFTYDRTDSEVRNADSTDGTGRHNLSTSNPSGSDTDSNWINAVYHGDLA
tara:strand:- start:208 stop:636 length:429 start_codon:yes stop_codon:yes gene_type:complete